MARTEKQVDDLLEKERIKNTKETNMKTITIDKWKFNAMKYSLITLSLAAVIAVSVFCGRNWGYNDHLAEVNKISIAAQQLKTNQ